MDFNEQRMCCNPYLMFSREHGILALSEEDLKWNKALIKVME
jgi:hypothetical protein